MASNYLERGDNAEVNSETNCNDRNIDRYNNEVFEGTSNYNSRRRNHNPTQTYMSGRQNNYYGHQENKYFNKNRHRYDGNVRRYDKNEDNINDEVSNLAQDISNMNATSSNYFHPKRNTNPRSARYSRKQFGSANENMDVQEPTGFVVEEQIVHSQPRFNQVPNKTTTPKHWNNRNNKRHYKGYNSGQHGGQEDSGRFNSVNDENWRNRNSVTFNSEDGGTPNTNNHHRSRQKNGWRNEERIKPFWPTKVEKSKAVDKFNESRDSDSFENSKFVEMKQETFETQRESLMDQLRRNSYECLVCCSSINRKASIWSCSTCFNIFHLSCIQRWAVSSAVEVPRVDEEEVKGEKKFWRCPTCQNSSCLVPDEYLCFCGKLQDPQLSFDAPHSCGEICGKKRGRYCKHPCNILCHPGPCPPCVTMVTTTCGCGRKTSYVKCNSAVDLKCEEVCNKSLNCGNHTCDEICHKGSCEPCQIEVEQVCHCGKQSRKVPCGSKESFSSIFSCMEKCEKLMDCKNHSCPKICHPGDCPACLLKPELINHCACGNSDVESLLLLQSENKTNPSSEEASLVNKTSRKKKKKSEETKEEESSGEICWPRTSCLDPLPRCGKVCGKELQCGSEDEKHFCKSKCHNGPCLGCPETSKVVCSCGSNSIEIPCKEFLSKLLQGQKIRCGQKCGEKLSCGRHVCTTNCCADSDHVCKKICKRNLSCGQHKCPDRCHSGKCEMCWLTSFEELTCRCGAQVIYPPVSCGTKRPQCHRPCSREHACDHEVLHTCHDDDECPPCVHLIERMCLCGRELRRNVPCYFQDVRCGNQCGKVLPCGAHFCLRSCHKGDCLDALNPKCTQPCQFSRISCSHACLAPCHMDEPCPVTDCMAEVQIRCECGRKEGKISCRMKARSINDNSNAIPPRFGPSDNPNRLMCDRECAVYKRNKKLAEAFNIDNPNLTSEPEIKVTYSPFLKDFAKKNALFVSKIEYDLRELVKGAKMLQQDNDRKCHSFKIMKREQRQAVHELAECYNVETESQDEEPYRNVVAKATKSKSWLPKTPLVPTCSGSEKPNAFFSSLPASRTTTTVLPMVPTQIKKEVQQPARAQSKPVIDYFDYEG